jgi:hypothetical protein
MINLNAIKTTGQAIALQLTESTGTALCDSGGIPQYDENGCYIGSSQGYGRNWERNQCRDFESEPQTFLSFDYGIETTHNVYHFLKDHLEFNKEMNDLFHEFAETDEYRELPWLAAMEDFPAYAAKKLYEQNLEEDEYAMELTANGIYGEGNPITVNSYNGEDALSQTIQYVYFVIDGVGYAVVQTHNGADVRGGYSTPIVFECSDNSEGLGLFDNARVDLWCDGNHDGSHNWLSENAGCSWMQDGGSGGIDLDDLEVEQVDLKGDEFKKFLNDKLALLNEDEEALDTIYVDAEGNGYCPICGGKLSAGYY